MPRRARIDFCHAMRGHIAFCEIIATLVCGVGPAGAQGITCGEPWRPMQQIELMFGRNIGGRIGVSESAWSRFLVREVVPRFPNGLSVLDMAGRWQDQKRRRMIGEPSKLVIIVTADETAARDKIASIVAIYKEQFHQRSVGVISHPVCATF
jgi:Protein of unknown function (DUF3574)